MRMERVRGARWLGPTLMLAGALGASLAATSDANACAVAYPPREYVALSDETTLIVWDAEKKTEHFVRTPTFEGDPASFGFFVPTPVTPAVEKVSSAIIERIAALAEPPMPRVAAAGADDRPTAAVAAPPVVVTQRVTIDDFELVSLSARDAAALGDWLAKNGFGDKPALRTWWKPYVERGWIVNAMRYTGAKKAGKNEKIATPTLRLSFPIDAPFYPYTEPPPDADDERAFALRSGRCEAGKPCDVTPRRKLDLYFVSNALARGTIAGQVGGPNLRQVREVPSADIRAALGDTTTWKFDPNTRERWTLMHFVDTNGARAVADDIVFAAFDAQPTETADAKPARTPRATAAIAPHKSNKAKRVLFGFVALLALFGVGLALREQRA